MPNIYNPYYPVYPAQMNVPQAPAPQPVQQQIQNGGFLSVPSEDIVKSYPVAPGNCVTFKIEGQPIVMEKSMGFSQLDKPVFEKYRLIKEESDGEQSERECKCNSLKEQLAGLEEQITSLWEEIELLRERRKRNEHTSNGKSNQTKSDGGVIPEI